MTFHKITKRDLQRARRAFEQEEPRDLFYKAATELVDLALRKVTSISLAEAISVLLKTWNVAYYRFVRFDLAHFGQLETLLLEYKWVVERYRQRDISALNTDDESEIKDIFCQFELVLGPVGAAKCLHLLCPRFFPLWDRAIAREYELPLRGSGANSGRYLQFMRIAQMQIRHLAKSGKMQSNVLKAIDEYNYCHFTKGWI